MFYTHTKRIKIFNEAGFDYAEIEIPLYNDGYGKTEYLLEFEGYTYNLNLNGQVSRQAVDKNTIYSEDHNNWLIKKVAFPAIKSGSIIEYRTYIQSPFVFRLPEWYFQDNIPTLYSEIELAMIPLYEYAFITNNIGRFDIDESYKDKLSPSRHIGPITFKDVIYRMGLKEVPSFVEEPFIANRKDYIKRINFQLSAYYNLKGQRFEVMTDWQDLCEDLWKNESFGKYIKKSAKLAKELLPEINIHDNDLDAAYQMVAYVKQKFDWNGRQSKFVIKENPKDFVRALEGNTAEINLFLVALLREAGFEAHPVLVSTRSNGKINSKYPFLHQFNYVLAVVKSKDKYYLLDATDDLLANNLIPSRCINDQGLLVDAANPSWVVLRNNTTSQSKWQFTYNIDQNNPGFSESELILSANKYAAYKYNNISHKEGLDVYVSRHGFSNVIENKDLISGNNSDSIAYIIRGNSKVERIGDKLLIKPFLDFPIQENPFKSNKRLYPIDFVYPYCLEYVAYINVPAGYSFADLPDDKNINSELATVKIEYKALTPTKLQVKGVFSIKKSVYSTKEFNRLIVYFRTVVLDFNKEIVVHQVAEK